ncbi:phosphoglycerate mutase family protein [Mucilaginibacter sp. CSA2-8R]|uniref:phosphoglycerate mutase family protein n=1 Tax=Mucilaginibacter sp. CSA2-8R TaxID=3141542 RepID=UPI00315D1A6E
MLKRVVSLLWAVMLIGTLNTYAQKTTIWLVRHAEKHAEGAMSNTDPDLTADGGKRAQDLAAVLKKQKIDAVYSTPYKRTTSTGEPAAAARQLKIITYTAKDFKTFAAEVLQNQKGKEVLIVSHSNTVIPLAKSFGATVPFETLTDGDYDMLFRIVVDKDETAKLTISHYGAPHHTTNIPAVFKQ